MWLCKLWEKGTWLKVGKNITRCIKSMAKSIWTQIKRIRNLPIFVRAAILFILYTLATKPIESFASWLNSMPSLLSTNMTYIAETINANSNDLWTGTLQVVLILLFVGLASWLWDSDTDKKIDKLSEDMTKMKGDIIEEINRNKQQ